jgi:hypothetical protein
MNAADVPAISPEQALLIELLVNGVNVRTALGELDLTAPIVKAWLRSSPRFKFLAEVAVRPDNPDRATELMVLRHELHRAHLAAKWGQARAGRMLAGQDPEL